MAGYVRGDKRYRVFAALERATGKAVGMCALMRMVPDMKTLELGHIWYAPAVQGRGVNADMALTFLTACFEQWRYRRAEWKCDWLNGRSRAAALKLGFTFEGVFRNHMVVKGRNRHRLFRMIDSVACEEVRAERQLRGELAELEPAANASSTASVRLVASSHVVRSPPRPLTTVDHV